MEGGCGEGKRGVTGATEGIGCSAYGFACGVGYTACYVWEGELAFA